MCHDFFCQQNIFTGIDINNNFPIEWLGNKHPFLFLYSEALY